MNKLEFIEDCCVVMHNAYEHAAQQIGWETQQSSRQEWPDVPEANKATMRNAVETLLDYLRTNTYFSSHLNGPIEHISREYSPFRVTGTPSGLQKRIVTDNPQA